MFPTVMVPLKEHVPAERQLQLARSVTAPDGELQLVTLVRVGNDKDEVLRLRRVDEGLAALADSLRAEGYSVRTESGLVAVAAAADILRLATSRGVDLLVIGLAKRSRVGKALLGSDAQRILIGAPCPVLAVPLFAQ